MLHFVWAKNLPYSTDDVKKVCTTRRTCAEFKPRFYAPQEAKLIKATLPFERLSIDFTGPLPTSFRNIYLLLSTSFLDFRLPLPVLICIQLLWSGVLINFFPCAECQVIHTQTIKHRFHPMTSRNISQNEALQPANHHRIIPRETLKLSGTVV